MDFQLFSVLLTAFFNIWLVFLIWAQCKKKRYEKYFIMLSLGISGWIVSNYFSNVITDYDWALLLNKSIFATSAIAAAGFFLFSNSFPKYERIGKKSLIIYLICLSAVVLTSFSNQVVKEIYFNKDTNVSEINFGFGIYIYTLFIVTSLFLSIYGTVRNYLGEKDKIIKNTLKTLVVGMEIFLMFSVLTNLLLPLLFDLFDFTNFAPYYAILFSSFVTYIILEYDFLNIKIILTEFIIGLIALILLAEIITVPDALAKIVNSLILILFCYFGGYIIKTTEQENRRREENEIAIVHERALRHEAEDLANDLRHLNQAKTQFLLSTQHHLRSPLTIIQGYLSMVSEGSYGQVPAPVKEKVDISLNTTQKLINLVNEMLDVAHFQMNKGSVAKQPTDILQLVVGIVDDLQKNAESKKIYLRLDKKSPSFPQVAVDSHGIREAIYNIVDNAIKYTQEGGVTVTMGQTKDKLRISVIDTGIGLSDHDRRNLFNRTFERGSRAKEVNATGKGIGLYLAGQMIINNNGTIHAESEGRGKGTTFMIELPAISATPATSVSAEPTPMPIPKPPRRK